MAYSGNQFDPSSFQQLPDFQPPQAPATPNTTAQVEAALDRRDRRRRNGVIARRALFTTAGLGACAGAVALAPLAKEKVDEAINQAAHNALQAGINQGRQQVLNELKNLEGLALTDAIAVAELTRRLVSAIVIPLAQLDATVTGSVLDLMVAGTQDARDMLNNVHLPVPVWLDKTHDTLVIWRNNVKQLPKALKDYVNSDITAGEIYLKRLRDKIDAEQGTPTPTASS